MKNGLALSLTMLMLALAIAADPSPAAAAVNRAELAERVRAELLHAWHAYERYAWGHDELRPLSKTPRDWHAESLLMTPVDALDSLLLMGFKDEAEKAKALIVDKLSFDKDVSVKNFEITIRLLGGLLSGHQMTGDPRLLRLAEDRGTRLLPAFDSPTGMPWPGASRTRPSRCGTCTASSPRSSTTGR